jgi:Tfp pilus assembly protein PilF
VIAGLIVLPGCSSLGTSIAKWSTPKKGESAPVTLGKVQSDSIGRPLPGSKPPLPLALDESKHHSGPESRANVALAMGDMLERSGDLAGAREQFEQALKFEPKSLKAALALARTEARLGRPDAASRIYRDAEKYHRRNPAIFNDKGLMLAEQKDWAGAIAALRTAVKLDPKQSKYHNNLGMVLAWSGSYDEAWKEFREAVGPGPAHYNIALLHWQAGHPVEARDHVERALAAMPTLNEARELLAQIDAESPSGTLAATEPEVGMELEDVEQVSVPAAEPEVPEEQNIVPAVALEPIVEPEPAPEPEPPADPWARRWVPPKWLR